MKRVAVSNFWLLALMSLPAIIALTINPAYAAAAEKGPRCGDGLDNDGDGLIDADDPDCGGLVAGKTPQMVDANGEQFGFLTDFDEDELALIWYLLPDDTWIRIRFSQRTGTYVSGITYYDQEGCAGNAYVTATPTNIGFWIDFTQTGTLTNGDIVRGDGSPFSVTALSARFPESLGGCTSPLSSDAMVENIGDVVLPADQFTSPFKVKLR